MSPCLHPNTSAIDNQMYVAMCSPSRHPGAAYQAYGHSSVVDPLGNVVSEADEKEATVYVDIGESLIAGNTDTRPGYARDYPSQPACHGATAFRRVPRHLCEFLSCAGAVMLAC